MSESLTLQQLKDLKELARQMGAGSMGTVPISDTSITNSKIENLLISTNSNGTEFYGTSNTASETQPGSTLDILLNNLESRLSFIENIMNNGDSNTSGSNISLNPGGQLVTLAGIINPSDFPFSEGIGTEAEFNSITSITSVGTDLYIVDRQNRRIRKLNTLTSEVTTQAGTGGVNNIDGTGNLAEFGPLSMCDITSIGANLYISTGHVIKKINLFSNSVTTIAGRFQGLQDGIGTNALFNNFIPQQGGGITSIGINLYVCDTGKIRKINTITEEVTTMRNSAGVEIYYPTFPIMTSVGTNLFLTVTGPYPTIDKIDTNTGEITTFYQFPIFPNPISTIHLHPNWSHLDPDVRDSPQPEAIETDGEKLYVVLRLSRREDDTVFFDTHEYDLVKIVISSGEITTLLSNIPEPTDIHIGVNGAYISNSKTIDKYINP